MHLEKGHKCVPGSHTGDLDLCEAGCCGTHAVNKLREILIIREGEQYTAGANAMLNFGVSGGILESEACQRLLTF